MKALSIEESILKVEVEFNILLDFIKNNANNLNCNEMERGIFSRLMQIGLASMRSFFAMKGTGDVGDELKLEDGLVLKKESGLRERNYFSVFGKIEVPRVCYRSEMGGEGVMPLDAQADLPERCYSYLLQEWMDVFSVRDTFKESEISLEKLLGLNISASRFEVINRETSKHYEEFYENKEVPPEDTEGKLQVVSIDGKGVPVIKKEAEKLKARLGKGEKLLKKKEALVTVSYTVNEKIRTPEEVAENLVYPEEARKKREENKETDPPIKAQNIRRIASLELSKQEVVEETVEDAKRRDPEHKRQWIVLMDGALYLWTLVACILKGIDFVGILDVIHVTEYLWKAAIALHGEKSPNNKKWVYNHLLSILRGDVGRVIGGLKQTLSKQALKKSQREVLKVVIRYFENHQEWMRYDKYLQAGYPISTGIVESTCGHTVKDRMEGTGRRWSIEGAEATLLLRSIYTSNDWDAYWKVYMQIERNRLYGRIIKAGYADDYCAEILDEQIKKAA